MSWVNADGLNVKFGAEEGANVRGNEKAAFDNGNHVIEFIIKAADLQSATDAVLGSVTNSADGTGSFGVEVPQGARISALEVMTETAFTSTGTVGSAEVVIGLKKSSDRSTELDHNGFTTTAFVGSRIDAAGERTYIEVGSTGAGALIGTSLSEQGIISVSAPQHATHPLAAGVLRCRLYYRFI